jgi:hypothetical protein
MPKHPCIFGHVIEQNLKGNNMPQGVPDIVIGIHEIQILTDVLHPYALYIQQLFSSGVRSLSVVETNALRNRFLYLLRFPDQPPVSLTTHEFEVINQALDLFLRTIPQVVPPSEEREATFRACHRMQETFRKHIYPQRTKALQADFSKKR